MVDLWESRLNLAGSIRVLYLCLDLFITNFLRQQPWWRKTSHSFVVSCLTLTVLLPATAAAAFFVQEEAVKAEGDAEDGEADEEDVQQAADEDESEDAETEKGRKHRCSQTH